MMRTKVEKRTQLPSMDVRNPGEFKLWGSKVREFSVAYRKIETGLRQKR